MIEIERKFLVAARDWGNPLEIKPMRQAYLFVEKDRNLRIREVAGRYVLTLKIQKRGIERVEIEVELPEEEGRVLLDQYPRGAIIEKTREVVQFAGKKWEIDLFEGKNAGLIIAEIELENADETFDLPPWIGPEVTGTPRFYNASLSRHPFLEWGMSYAELLEAESA